MTGVAGPPGTYRAALGNRSFRLALESYTLAAVAQGAWTIALAVALYDQTGSPLWAAVAACTRLLPYLLLSPVAGVLADRWGHRRILEAATTARILLAIGVTVGIAVGAPPGVLAVVAFLATAAATPVYPALNAFVPTAVPPTDLAAANSLLSTTETLGWIAGPALGGFLVATTSATATAATATVVLTVGFVVLRRLPRDTGQPPDREAATSSVLAALADGVRALRRTGTALAVLLLILATNVIDGSAQVLLLLVADEQLDLGDGGYGVLTAVTGVGALGAVVVNRRMAAGSRPLAPLLAAVAAAGLGYALLGFVQVAPVAMGLLALVSGASVVVEVVSVTILQRSVPPTHLARVFGLLDGLVVAAIVAGTISAPLLEEHLGLTTALVVTGAIVPGLLAALAPLVWRAGRLADARGATLQPLVDTLAALPLLRYAPAPVLESLALSGRRMPVVAGQVVIRQGEASDDVYVVLSGSFVVLEAQEGLPPKVVNRCSTGDSFGVIGPLAGVPRTASVMADAAAELLRIPGPSFVAAVNGNALGAGGSAVAGIVTRAAAPPSPPPGPHDAPTRPG